MLLNKYFLCPWPIQFLQDELSGILTGDFVMLAMGSGGGKSTFSRALVNKARQHGTPVVLYSLEDEKGKYAMTKVYYKYISAGGTMNYRDWLLDKTLNPGKYEIFFQKAADESMLESNGLPLVTTHEDPNLTMNQVMRQMLVELKAGYRLFVIDHVDCLCPSERPEDMVATMTRLWNFVSEYQATIITFFFFFDRRNMQALCPALDDLRGSKAKIFKPTIVLSLARHDYGLYTNYPGKPTYCRILKNRDNGQNKAAVVFFQNGGYLPDYKIVDCNESGTRIDGETMASLSKKTMPS